MFRLWDLLAFSRWHDNRFTVGAMNDLLLRVDKAIRASLSDHNPCLPVVGNRHHVAQGIVDELLRREDIVSAETQLCRGCNVIGGIVAVGGKREAFLFTVTNA